MAKTVEPHEKVYRGKRDILINNFLGGISWALGATVGLAIIVAILTFILKNVNLVPVFGDFISAVINEIITKNPQWTQ